MVKGFTGIDVANTVRMMRTTFKGTIFIVEGDSDVIVLERFIDSSVCRIVASGGRPNTIEAVEILNAEYFIGFVAMVDADYWRLENAVPTIQNMVVTDSHDIETLILSSPALDKLCKEYGSAAKLNALIASGETVSGLLLKAALPIGCLRYCSLKHSLWIDFRDLKYSKFIDKKELVCSQSALVAHVRGKTSRILALTDVEVIEACSTLSITISDPWQACAGDDMIGCLSIALKGKIGTKNNQSVLPKNLLKVLRLAYEFSYFQNTTVYADILAWTKVNSGYIVF